MDFKETHTVDEILERKNGRVNMRFLDTLQAKDLPKLEKNEYKDVSIRVSKTNLDILDEVKDRIGWPASRGALVNYLIGFSNDLECEMEARNGKS